MNEMKYIKATLSAFGPDEGVTFTQDTWAQLHKAMNGLVSQPAPVQEPVACVQDLDEVKRKHLVYEKGMDWKDPLYTTPPAAQPAPVQEPVCHICKGTGEMDSGGTQPWGEAINIPCECTAPPVAQRQWVGLNEDQRNQIRCICDADIPAHVFHAIEANLKEKNT